MKEHEGAFIEQFKDVLGLTWGLNQVYGNVGDVRLASSKSEQAHQLTLPMNGLSVDAYRTDIALMLSKAKLAESRDPLFSTVRFRPEYDITDRQFQRNAHQVYYAQQVTDIWGMDLVAGTLGRDMVHEEIDSWLGLVRQIPDESIEEIDLAYAMGFASRFAMMRRYCLTDLEPVFNQEVERLRRMTDLKGLTQILNLAQYYQHLPSLTQNPDGAVIQLEQATRELSEILGFSAFPSIVKVNNDWVWDIWDIGK